IETNVDLVDLVGKLNQVVFNNTEPERYITFVLALLDTNAGTMTYVNAGHNFPFVIKSDTKEVNPLCKGGLPLGMFDGISFQKETVLLGKNDSVVMYTDGVTEAMNTSAKEYSEDRFKRCIVEHSHKPVNDLKEHIISDVEQFTEGQFQSDDLTLLLLKRIR
ncbi:MAG: serine/threonine-protein phosphatase, partial [Ignavibacteriales bacterium]|nr:serine/threonine-protein phosphatase [Ignavibacteriales bacterium]